MWQFYLLFGKRVETGDTRNFGVSPTHAELPENGRMDTGKIVIGFACITLSAGMLISPSGAAMTPYSPAGQEFQAGVPVPAACRESGDDRALSTTCPGPWPPSGSATHPYER